MNTKKGLKAFFFWMILFLFIVIFYLQTSNSQIAYAENEIEYTTQPVITVLTHGLGGEPVDWSNTEFIIRVNE